jgi:iron(III) transport system substrate-binding protein
MRYARFLTAFASSLLLSSLLASAPDAVAADAIPPDVDAWMKTAKLGPYDKGLENWDEIVANAKKEGEVVVYSSSSRITAVAKAFMDRYPEIKVRPFDLGSVQAVEKTIREQDAGLFNADIVTTGTADQVIVEMLNKHRIVNYVPKHFIDRIPLANREPLLVRVNEAVAILYSGEVFPDEEPVKNLWELTEPKWKGRVGIKNPLTSGSVFAAVATIVQHADELAAAYQRHTGRPIQLSPGVPDAGYEFIARLLKNDLVAFESGPKLAEASGKKGQKNPFLAITNMTHLSYNDSEGRVNKVLSNVDPISKVDYPTYMGIARHAKHPNAAKLMTAFLLGSTELTAKTELTKPYGQGKSLDLLLGFAPYFDPGGASPRNDVPLPAGGEVWSKMKYWTEDGDYIWKNGPKIRDFWTVQSAK